MLQVTSPAPRDVWQEILKADSNALVFQTPEWLDCLCSVEGYEDASRLYETADGRRILMPMAHRKSILGLLDMQYSLPNSWGMGGLISDGAVTPDDVAAIVADLGKDLRRRIRVRPNPLAAAAWRGVRQANVTLVPRLAHVLDLEGGFDHVWTKRFSSATRNKIRKAQRSQLVVENDSTGKLAPVFFRLLQLSVDRWAEQQHEPKLMARWRARKRDPLHKFEGIAKSLGNACRISVAWLDGKPAAAILVVQGANANYTRGAMDKELAAPTNANDLLQFLAIKEACEAGCRYYHMGESGASVPLAQFKERFGAQPIPYAECHIERLPFTSVESGVRGFGKRLIGFRDA